MMMTDLQSWDFASIDGVKLRIHETGQGKPLILLHGLFSSAATNWIKFGHAELLAKGGYRVIMPDLRGHGESAAPHDPAAYPMDILLKDVIALIDHLQLNQYDLGGFSLGARITAKLLTSLSPRKAMLIGMGLEGLAGWARRQEFFLSAIALRDIAKRGDPHWFAIQFMKSQKIDPIAAGHLLKTFSDLPPAEISKIMAKTLVLCGDEDRDNGDPQALTDLLANGSHVVISGNHLSSVTKPEMGNAMLAFLNDIPEQ